MNVPALNSYHTIEQGLFGNNIPKNLIDFLVSIFSQPTKTFQQTNIIRSGTSLKAKQWFPAIGDSTFFTKSYVWEGIVIGEQKSLGLLKKVYKNSFMYHLWNILSSPVL